MADDEMILKDLRKKVFITGYKGGMAHLASCFSCIDMIYALYSKGILQYDHNDPKWNERDRFILSKGHAGLAFYSVLLHESLITEQMYESYLTEESLIGGEPCMRDCEWVEASTGSLGHGLPVAVGMAIALKSNKSHAKVYVMLGDGECQEGSVWESMIVAASMKLNNLVVILDNNKIQKMDLTENTMGTPDWDEKFASFGFEVRTVNGHDVESFVKTVKRNNDTDKPLCIIADTVKGKGVSIMENNPNWHFKLPGRKDLKVFKQELGISDEELL